MTNSIIPYSFTPGTKAKAQELNANFNALAEKIESNNATTVHTTSNATIEGELSFSTPIYSNEKHHDTKGNLTIKTLADGDISDAILAINDTDSNCAGVRITNQDGYNEISLNSYNEDGTSKSSITLRNTDGTSYATAPTYSSNYADNSDKIVTTSFMANHWVTAGAGTSTTASKARPAVVVTNYKNGNSWYRIWSDGWKEQGGRITVNAKSNATVTYPKAFSGTNYALTHSLSTSGTNEYSFNVSASIGSSTYSTTQFNIRNDGLGSAITVRWIACGY